MSGQWCNDCAWPEECASEADCLRRLKGQVRGAATSEVAAEIEAVLGRVFRPSHQSGKTQALLADRGQA